MITKYSYSRVYKPSVLKRSHYRILHLYLLTVLATVYFRDLVAANTVAYLLLFIFTFTMSSNATTAFDRVSIELLTGKENFVSWTIKMQDILEELELWDNVDGAITKPEIPPKSAGKNAPDYAHRVSAEMRSLASFNKLDRRALRMIRL